MTANWDGNDRRSSRADPPPPPPPPPLSGPISAMERHAQTIVAAMILAGALWVGSMLIDLRDRMGRAEERESSRVAVVAALTAQLQQSLSERYSANDARRDQAEIARRLGIIEDTITRIEQERRK